MGFDGRHARVYVVWAPLGGYDFMMAVAYFRTIRGRRRCLTPSPKLRHRG